MMDLVEVKKSKRNHHNGILMLRVSESEALRLVESLVQQIQDRNSNGRRWEAFLKDGRDFSIAVHCSASSQQEKP